MANGMDKRRFPRAKYNCTIFIKKSDTTKTIFAVTENLGGGGIGLVLEEDLGLFQGVDVEIRLEDGEGVVKCKATTVWVVKKTDFSDGNRILYDTGLEFVNIKENDRVRISNEVENILRKEKSQS